MKRGKRLGKIKGLSLHLIPFSEIAELSIAQRVRKILSLVLGNKIVILQGRLRAEEEARLIEDTMAMVEHVKNFKGIELAVIEPNLSNASFFVKMKHRIARSLVGDNSALTVVGPASVIKEIKKDPRKLELMIR
ncbi:DUF2073 domain-containing protein [Candidatus Pacearchaeota archaeon]|nr:MAG: DUF2073 domain-containing protein [Candidatus Pacearchaeota archaeon]